MIKKKVIRVDFINYYRKLSISVRVFFNAHRFAINISILVLLIFGLAYNLINSYIFPKVVVEKARTQQFSRKYDEAVSLYDTANNYYKVNHFLNSNKKIYFGIPYQKAVCFLGDKNKKASIQSMSDGVSSIQVQYGIFSPEFAYFIRKYLIQYYLEYGNIKLATKEFDNLLLIYKNIPYSDAELADITRLSGDLYYQKKQYDVAMQFYKRAYNVLVKSKDTDYEVFSEIVDRIAQYDLQEGKVQLSLDIYKSSIDVLRNSGKEQSELTAVMLIKYGTLCSQQNKLTDAIASYEEAIALIKKLPRSNYLNKSINFYLSILQNLYSENSQFTKARAIQSEIAHPKASIFHF